VNSDCRSKESCERLPKSNRWSTMS
jgi:hypothetical protein